MAEAKKIPQRSQVPVEYTWNTADIYPTDEAWEKEFAEVRAQIPVLAGYAGRLGENAQTLWDYLTLCDKTVEQVTRLYQYACARTRTPGTAHTRPWPARARACGWSSAPPPPSTHRSC